MAAHTFERPVEIFTERTPRVVSAAKLHRSAQRRKTGQFLAEGWNAVSEAIRSGTVVDIYVTAEAAARYDTTVSSALDRHLHVHYITAKADKLLTDTVTPPGIYAVCASVTTDLAAALAHCSHPQLVLVGVDISDPGNAGTMIRLADAFGADMVVFAGHSVDPENTKCVRSSAGSIYHLPVCRESDTEAALSALQSCQVQLLATALDGEIRLDQSAELLARPTAWLLGNEAHGLHPAVAAQADHTVAIPMRGRAESLNLAAAAAICLYTSATTQQV